MFGDFKFLLEFFHRISHSLIHVPGSIAGKSGLKSNSEAWDDALIVHGFSIVYKADFHILRTFPMA